MQFKDFVSKKAVVAAMVILALGVGLIAGITYRSAYGQSSTDTGIMPQKNVTSNYTHYNNSSSADGQVAAPATTPKKTTPATALDAACPVKAETNAKGVKVFYLPNMRGYAKVPDTNCFKSAELAAAAGYKSASAK